MRLCLGGQGAVWHKVSMSMNANLSDEALATITARLQRALPNPHLEEMITQLWATLLSCFAQQSVEHVMKDLAGALRTARIRASRDELRTAVLRVAQREGDAALIVKLSQDTPTTAITEVQAQVVTAAIERLEPTASPVEQLVERTWPALRERVMAGLRLRELVAGLVPAVASAGVQVKPSTLRAAIRSVARRRQDNEVLMALGISAEPDRSRYRGGGRKAKKRPAKAVPTEAERRLDEPKPGGPTAGNRFSPQPVMSVPTAR